MTTDHMLTADWMTSAHCVGTDPSAWFPDRGGAGVTILRRICALCPVQQQCLDLAMSAESTHSGTDHRHGVYGGLTPTERHELAKHRRNQ